MIKKEKDKRREKRRESREKKTIKNKKQRERGRDNERLKRKNVECLPMWMCTYIHRNKNGRVSACIHPRKYRQQNPFID